jgi:hypothetical protein
MRYFLIFFRVNSKHGEMSLFSEKYPNRTALGERIAAKSTQWVTPADVTITNIVEVSKEDFMQYTS